AAVYFTSPSSSERYRSTVPRTAGFPLIASASKAAARTTQFLSPTAFTSPSVVFGSRSFANTVAAAARAGEVSPFLTILRALQPRLPKGIKPQGFVKSDVGQFLWILVLSCLRE